jgi:hypothetical protein
MRFTSRSFDVSLEKWMAHWQCEKCLWEEEQEKQWTKAVSGIEENLNHQRRFTLHHL